LVDATPRALADAAFLLWRDAAQRQQMGAAGKRRAAEMYAWTRGAQDFWGALWRSSDSL